MKGRRLPECGPKTLSRPRAVKTDLKVLFFHFPAHKEHFSVQRRTIGSLRAFKNYPFFALRSLDHNSDVVFVFFGSKLSQERYSFVNYKLITLAFASYFPHKSNVSAFSVTAFENHLNNYGRSQPIRKPFVSRVHLIKKLGTLLVLGGLTREQKLYERV